MSPPSASRALPASRAIRTTSLIALALAILLGAFLGSAGWASKLPDVDTYPYVHDAGELVRHGTLPVIGNVQSFGGFNPPGDTYLFVPGAMLFRDVRLWPLPSAIAFYVALVVGVRLLLGRLIAPTSATFAACGFALSAGAIETAGTLWTRMQSPAFLTWTLLFLVLWAERRNAWWLAAALATWAASLYVFPETLLAGVFFPIVWWLRRPPIRIAPVACAILACVALAWPYLAYESRHGFGDVIRIFTQAKLPLPDLRERWCDAMRTLIELGDDGQPRAAVLDAAPPSMGVVGRVVAKAAAIVSLVVSTFTRNGPLALTMLAALAIAAVGLARAAIGGRSLGRHGATVARACGIACVIVAAIVSLTLVRRVIGDRVTLTPRAIVNLQACRVMLASVGVVLIARPLRSFASRRLLPAFRDDALSLIAWPTLALIGATLAAATPGRPDRGWQFWPLVVVVALAGLDRWIAALSPRIGATARGAIVVACAAMLAFNGSLLTRARQIAHDGWPGPTSPIVALLDDVANASRGQATVRLGLHAAVARYEFAGPARDVRDRVGSGGDAYLLNRYGIANETRCVEGLSDADKWRIVGPPEPDAWVLDTRPDEYVGWTTVAEHPPLRLLRRP